MAVVMYSFVVDTHVIKISKDGAPSKPHTFLYHRTLAFLCALSVDCCMSVKLKVTLRGSCYHIGSEIVKCSKCNISTNLNLVIIFSVP